MSGWLLFAKTAYRCSKARLPDDGFNELLSLGDRRAHHGVSNRQARKAIRILLHSEGVLRNDDYLNPSRVFAVLRTFAKTRASGCQGNPDTLDLSHQLALLGSRGVSPRRLEFVARFTRSRSNGHPAHCVCQLGSRFIGYTGPLFKGLTPDRSASLVHFPLLQPDPVAVAWDEAAARAL